MCYDAPKMDPSVAEATRGQTEIAREQMELARDQMERGNKLIDEFAPRYRDVIDQNLEIGRDELAFSREQRGHYRDTFMPVERKLADEAMNYDSEAEVARRTGLAAGTVQRQADAAAESKARQMAAMGVSPTSGRTQQSMTDQANMTALAKAGAVNKERNDTKLTGIALRQGAANLGRGIAGASMAGAGSALQAGQGATGAMGSATGQAAGALAPAQSFYSGASGAFGGAGSLGVNQFNAQAQSNRYSADSMGSTIGTIGSIVGMLALSSKKAKKNVKPVDDDAAMQAMRETPVKEFDYKPGMGDGGHHIGPMAEDMQAAAGDQVAPGGKQIDLISMLGVQQAGMRSLDKRLAALESGEKPTKAPRASMSMNPLPL